MSIDSADTVVAPSHVAVDAVYTLVNADATVTGKFAGTKALYKHWKPADSPFQFVMVHERIGFGSDRIQHHKIMNVPVLVTTACRAQLANGATNEKAHEWLALMQDTVADTIVGQRPSGLHNDIAFESVSPPVLDPDENYWSQSYTYSVLIDPV